MTDFNADQTAVIEKVRKLLALAQGNSNEHEAAAATEKAMELLAAYNLEMHVVDKAGKAQTQRNDKKKSGGLYGWQRSLWQGISDLNFCHYEAVKGLARGSKYEHRIIGSQANAVATEMMADYLQGTVERLAQHWAKGQGYNSVFVREAIAYREGMATRLCQRLSDIRWQRLAEERRKRDEAAKANPASGSNALVLQSVIDDENDLNLDYIYGYEPGTHSQRRRDAEARRAVAKAVADAELRAREEAEKADPSLRAAREQREAEQRAADAKWYADYCAKQARKRSSTRERALTPAEQREQLSSYGQGYRKGDEIGLDQQVAGSKTRSIR